MTVKGIHRLGAEYVRQRRLKAGQRRGMCKAGMAEEVALRRMGAGVREIHRLWGKDGRLVRCSYRDCLNGGGR